MFFARRREGEKEGQGRRAGKKGKVKGEFLLLKKGEVTKDVFSRRWGGGKAKGKDEACGEQAKI